jgi:nucleotide-binding universal stress UspA family protein
MKTILILTDFSNTATHAVEYLSSIAEQLNVNKIIVYHSAHIPSSDMIFVTDVLIPMPNMEYEQYKDTAMRLERTKTMLASKLPASITIDVQTDNRSILKAVEDFTENENIELVVMGIRGSGDKGTNSVGRIPANLITRHEISLLIVPSTAPLQPVKKVMLACELKDIAERLPADQLKDVVKQLNAELYIVNIDQDDEKGTEEYIKEQTALYQLLDEINPQFNFLDDKDIVNGLMAYSDEHQIDMMVGVPKKKGFLEMLFQESSSKKLAVKATKPLLLLHKKI